MKRSKLTNEEVDRLCRLVAAHAAMNAQGSVITVCTCDMCKHAYAALDAAMQPIVKRG